MVNLKEEKIADSTCMCKALLYVKNFAIRGRYGRCKCQKDGRKQRKEEQRNACHGCEEASGCGGFTKRRYWHGYLEAALYLVEM